jgi:hypothetical protein
MAGMVQCRTTTAAPYWGHMTDLKSEMPPHAVDQSFLGLPSVATEPAGAKTGWQHKPMTLFPLWTRTNYTLAVKPTEDTRRDQD